MREHILDKHPDLSFWERVLKHQSKTEAERLPTDESRREAAGPRTEVS